MIIEFSITNFRSIKEKQTFSFVAETTKSKRETNTFEVELQDGSKLRLLRSAVMYGANASGKSNFIRAFGQLRAVVFASRYAAIGELIYSYTPFLFDVATKIAPTTFECTFIAPDNIKYRYTISFDQKHILNEELSYFPKQIEKNLFKRIVEPTQEFDSAKFNRDAVKDDQAGFSNPSRIFKNQAILSMFGREIPHEQLSSIYLYFSGWRVWDANNSESIQHLTRSIIENVIPQERPGFFLRLQRLIKVADTKVNAIVLKPSQESTEQNRRTGFTAAAMGRLFGLHNIFNGDENAGVYELPFIEESAGTKVLFALGALVLNAIETGGPVIFDELDNSLHPRVARLFVHLFNSPQYNPKNAQLIFSSHEANLMDKDMFRSDQIWFAQKDEKGATEIYSVQDFEGVREDISFEKWYLSGKFGAIPQPGEIAYIFSDAEETTRPA